MTIDEAIKRAEEIAEYNQKVVDTHHISDDISLDELYADDTEIIDEQLEGYKECADDYSQLSEWLKDYKRLLEQQPCEKCVSLASVYEIIGNLMAIPYDFDRNITEQDVSESMDEIRALPHVTPKAKWIPVNERLPEDRENVLFSIKAGIVFEGRFFNDKTNLQWYEYRYKQFEPNSDVTAWQSLPKPYKAEMESEE